MGIQDKTGLGQKVRVQLGKDFFSKELHSDTQASYETYIDEIICQVPHVRAVKSITGVAIERAKGTLNLTTRFSGIALFRGKETDQSFHLVLKHHCNEERDSIGDYRWAKVSLNNEHYIALDPAKVTEANVPDSKVILELLWKGLKTAFTYQPTLETADPIKASLPGAELAYAVYQKPRKPLKAPKSEPQTKPAPVRLQKKLAAVA
jgi:hypothetical protein